MMPKQGAWQYRPSPQRSRSRCSFVGSFLMITTGYVVMPLDLNRLVQVDAMGLAKAFQVLVFGHTVVGGSLGHQVIVAEVLMPSQDQTRACLDQDHAD